MTRELLKRHDEQPAVDFEVIPPDILVRHLGPVARGIELAGAAIGNHYVTGSTMGFLRQLKPTMVMGEISRAQLRTVMDQSYANNRTIDVFQALFHPGLWTHPSLIQDHQDNVRKLLSEGVTFCATDDRNGYLSKDGTETISIVPIGLAGLYLGINAATATIAAWRHIPISRRQFLGASLKTALLGGAAYTTAALSPLDINTFTRIPIIEKIAKWQIVFEKMLVPHPPFVNFTEGTIKLRNLGMAQNSWHAIARNLSKDGSQRLVLMAGAAHGTLVDAFNKGPELIEEQLHTYAHSLLDITLEFLLAQNLEVKEIIDQLVQYAELFPEVDSVGKQAFSLSDTPQTTIPKTARTIFFEEAINRISELTSLGRKDDTRVRILRQTVENLWLGNYRQARKLWIQAEDFLKLGSPAEIQTDFQIKPWILNQGLHCNYEMQDGVNGALVGYAHLNSTYLPVARTLMINEGDSSYGKSGSVRITDSVMGSQGERIMQSCLAYLPLIDRSCCITPSWSVYTTPNLISQTGQVEQFVQEEADDTGPSPSDDVWRMDPQFTIPHGEKMKYFYVYRYPGSTT